MTNHIFAAAADNAVRNVIINEDSATITFVFIDGAKSETPIASSVKATIASFDKSGEWVRVQ